MLRSLVVVALAAAGLLCSSANALYSVNSPVSVVDAAGFKKIKQSDDVVLVEFFADWCGHCKAFAPELEKAARALKGVVRVVASDDQGVAQSESVKGYPTVKLFTGKSEKLIPFEGARTADAVVEFVMKQLGELTRVRLGGKKKGSDKALKKSDVIELTDDNFEELVMKDDKNVWFIEFFAPWCGHCKALAPIWENVASKLKGKVKIAKMDATVHTNIPRRFGVEGFPTLKLLGVGEKSMKTAVAYNGPRESEDIMSFAMGFAGESAKAEQLLTDDQFNEECQKGVCIISILPDIYDTMAAGRDKYLKDLNNAVRLSSSMPVKFFWLEAGKNFDFEEALHLQFGYPATVAVHLDKKKFGIHKGQFNTESLRSFLVGLMSGKQTLSPLPKLPALKKMTPWDGKDPVPLSSNDDEL